MLHMMQYQGGLASPPQRVVLFRFADPGQADSSDEEKEQPKAKVTSVDEALRTVTGPADRSSQEDFLRQNFETLAQTSSSSSSGGGGTGRRGPTLPHSLNLCVCSKLSNCNTFFPFLPSTLCDFCACAAEQIRVRRLSMSSRFLATGHSNRYCCSVLTSRL